MLNFTRSFLSAGLVSERSLVKLGEESQESHDQGCCAAWEVFFHLSVLTSLA